MKTLPQLLPTSCCKSVCSPAAEKRVRGNTYVDQDTKGNPEEDANDNVDGPVGKGARERNEPYQGKENAEGSDDFRVNEAPLRSMGALGLVKVFTIDTGDNSGEDELCTTEDQADETIDSHGE